MSEGRTEISTLWWRWIVVVAAFGLIFGLALVFTPRLLDLMNAALYDSVFGAGAFAALDDAQVGYHDWAFGVTGATLAALSVLIGALAWYPFRRGEKWAWWALAVALLVWFVPDTITTWAHGVPPNLLVNVAFLGALGVPLLGSWRAFR